MTETAFDQQQFDAAYPEGVEHHFWTSARNRVVSHQLRAHGLRQSRIIEVGCGKGIVVDFLRSAGFDCWGVELADVHPEKRICKYIYTNCDALNLPSKIREAFKVIMLLDVIEHIPKPAAFITNLLKRYPQVEHLIMTVPARQELWSNYDEWYHHVQRYDLNTTTRTMIGCGQKRIEVQYFSHLLYIPLRLMLVLTGRRSVQVASPSVWLRPLHWLIAQVLYLDYRLLPKRSLGTSIFCYAHIER